MKRILIILILIPLGYCGFTQDYLNAAGYRGGQTFGLEYKVCTNDVNAYEALLSFRSSGVQLTGLALFHTEATFGRNRNFFWYYGFGGHVGYNKIAKCIGCLPQDTTITLPQHQKIKTVNNLALGVDFIGGLEYRFLSIPFTVGVDWKPFIGFFGPAKISRSLNDWALTIKYTFK